jgi:hypothetical protein
MIQLSDLREIDGLYYVGDIADVDGSPWVDLETAELVLLEVNSGTQQPVTWLDEDSSFTIKVK